MKPIVLILLIMIIPSTYGIAFGLSPNQVIIKNNWTMYKSRIIVFNPSNASIQLDLDYDKSKILVLAPEKIKPNSRDYINYTIISKHPFNSEMKITVKFNSIQLKENVKFRIGHSDIEKPNSFLGIILIITIILLGLLIFNKGNIIYS